MRHLSTTLLLVLMFGTAAPAMADRFTASDRGFRVAQQDCTSLSEAVEQVRRRYKGRIVSAETTMRGKREVHVIKVLTDDGKVKTVQIPGCSRGA